ncbi:MAG: porin [Thiobacillus sp.]|uniref:porin n=1 Tax=Thiobacillus sp. TaxID=924 RepID=UPI002736F647|nr:porin [Thiobacillus sp.]MDP3586121.1 porin [Thiobacillus sp.]
MMKKILAAAIVSAFAAPAFAATANVDVYGKLHLSINAFDDQPSNISDVGISSNASRIGFKGTEDLGGGLAAIWQIEQTVNMDEGSGNFATRNTFVGLKGGFGTALIGRHDTPLKLVGRTVDLFGDTMADSRNVMADANGRPNNVLMYTSPTFTGVNIAAAYVTGSSTTTTSDADDTDMYSLSVTYKNGPLFLGAAYEDGDGLSATVDKAARLAAGFTMGNLKFVAQYDKTDSISGTADSDAWMVGAGFTMGNVVLKANYMESDVDNTGNDPQQWTIGADYNLSKRTSVYALYANGEYINVGAGAGTSDQVGSCTTCGGDISVISLGVVHTF